MVVFGLVPSSGRLCSDENGSSLSLPSTPPLQGGDCTLYSLLRVSGERNEPGLFCAAVNQDFVFHQKCPLQTLHGLCLTWGREGTFAAEGFNEGVRMEK